MLYVVELRRDFLMRTNLAILIQPHMLLVLEGEAVAETEQFAVINPRKGIVAEADAF